MTDAAAQLGVLLNELFRDRLGAEGYEVLTEAADRHGSFEWQAWKSEELPHSTLHRFVTLHVLVAGPDPEAPDAVVAEVWIAAETDDRFDRWFVVRRTYRADDLKDGLGQDLERATTMAAEISPRDLGEVRLRATL